MNTVVIGELLSGIELLIPLIPGGAAIEPVVKIITKIVPVIIQEAQDLMPVVKNIIATLKADAATTEEQLATLAELEAIIDAAFDQAAAKVEAEDQ